MNMNKIKGERSLESIDILMRVAEMERERYSKSGDYSVTDIISPPRVVHLKKRYGHLAVPDLGASIPSMLGTAIHEYFEKYLDMWCAKHEYDDYTLEEQVQIERQGRRISGRYDIRERDQLYDLKSIKVWKLIFDRNLDEYHEQQNLYRLLIKLDKGTTINGLNIVAIYKDWQEGNALRDRHYPQQQVIEYSLSIWPLAKTEEFLDTKLAELIRCEELEDEALPICTRDERWERHPGGETLHFAILKNRQAKRATKVVRGGTLDDAVVVARGMKGMTTASTIEVRYAMPKRCMKYCDTNEYCSFYKSWAAKHRKGQVNDYFDFKV
jgi:hypothetical protein